MKVFTIDNQRYTITPIGYGQYQVSNGNVTLRSSDSRMYDAIDDEDDPKHLDALVYYPFLFLQYEQLI
jgi:hypothetical protein